MIAIVKYYYISFDNNDDQLLIYHWTVIQHIVANSHWYLIIVVVRVDCWCWYTNIDSNGSRAVPHPLNQSLVVCWMRLFACVVVCGGCSSPRNYQPRHHIDPKQLRVCFGRSPPAVRWRVRHAVATGPGARETLAANGWHGWSNDGSVIRWCG